MQISSEGPDSETNATTSTPSTLSETDPTTAGPTDTEETTEEGTSSQTDASESSESSDASDTDAMSQALAGGISLTAIEVNQGVGIPVASAGTFIAPEDFVAPVIGDRPALVRAMYTLDPEFEAREIEAHLEVVTGGNQEIYVDTRNVTGPPDETQLDGTFNWEVDAETFAAGSEIRVALYEPEGVSESVGAVLEPALPDQGTADIGVWGDHMVIDIMLVPFSCDGFGSVEINDADLEEFEAYLFNTFPVQAINIEVHELEYSSTCSEVDAAEFDLPALRQAEDAPPYVYYGGLLPGDGGGYSVAIEPSDQMTFRRTFANHTWRWYGLTFDLFAHELGHNHGRNHTFEDPSYPLDNSGYCGVRETYGYGVVPGTMPQCGYSNDKDIGIDWISPNEQLLPPTNTDPCDGLPEANRGSWSDMMSYAYPYWVSAYTYKAYAERVRLISSWRSGMPQPLVPGLRVVLDGEGKITPRIVEVSSSRKGIPGVSATCFVAGREQALTAYPHTTHVDFPQADGSLRRIEHTVVEIPGVTAAATSCSWGSVEVDLTL